MIVGILGGGQLARMLALAGHPLGFTFVFLDPASDACAFALGESIRGNYDNPEALAQLAQRANVVTYEFENVPAASARFLSEHVAVYPSSGVLAAKQDRLLEKQLFRALDIPTAAWLEINNVDDLRAAADSLGLPLVLKTRSHGYDGKGQRMIFQRDEIAPAWEQLGGLPAIAEKYVSFKREVSMVAVRSRTGENLFYPVSENVHRDGILYSARARPNDPIEPRARAYAHRLLTHFDYTGVLTLELFQDGDQLLANEFAPRVHNSGHWTIEGAETSQFENHLRAIAGLPLGDTDAVGHTAMVNCIGAIPDPARVLQSTGAHLHVYGKAERPGRKVGHVTVRAADPVTLQARFDKIRDLIGAK